jgi:hypothetical protein
MKPKMQTFTSHKRVKGFDIHEVMNFITNKYQFNCFDIFGSLTHFDNWCDQKGYGQKDPVGEKRGSSQIWFSEYQKDAKGEVLRPEFADVIGWFIHYYLPESDLAEFDLNQIDFSDPTIPDYIKEFYGYVLKDFGQKNSDITLVLNNDY